MKEKTVSPCLNCRTRRQVSSRRPISLTADEQGTDIHSPTVEAENNTAMPV